MDITSNCLRSKTLALPGFFKISYSSRADARCIQVYPIPFMRRPTCKDHLLFLWGRFSRWPHAQLTRRMTLRSRSRPRNRRPSSSKVLQRHRAEAIRVGPQLRAAATLWRVRQQRRAEVIQQAHPLPAVAESPAQRRRVRGAATTSSSVQVCQVSKDSLRGAS